MLRSQLADLWKSRVQHLRQYYCFHGYKPKQRSSPAISRHVWFIPLILTLWWLLIAVIFLYTLKMEHLLSAGEILRYELYLNFLLTILWWKLAVTESEGTSKTRFRNGPHCSCTMCTNHRNGCTIARGNVSMVILPLRHNWKCYRRRRVLQTVQYSDHKVVTSLLLILAGDVETNPGPGIDADDSTILVLDDINDVMDELKDVLASYEGIGWRLNIPNDKLEEIRGQNLSAAAAMRKVIMEWLKRNYPSSSLKPPTWKILVDAVEHPVGGNNRAKAEEIASRHKAVTTLKLTESDQDAICQFLKYLPGSDVKKLGEILQLQSRTLEKMKDFPLDINVLLESIITDACTWDHLIGALKKIGRDSEAQKIGGLYTAKKTFGDLGVYDKHPKEPAVVTLEEICKNVKVSPKTLDQECTDEVQAILADYCVDWEEVARKLFPLDTVDNLIDDVGKKKPRNQRSEFVRRWKEEYGHTATYKRFFKALLELKFTTKVENAIEKLKELLEQHPKELAAAAAGDIEAFHLQLIKWINPKGEEAKLKIFKEMSPKWKVVAGMIGLSKAEIDYIAAPGMGREIVDCMRDVFGKWMENCDVLPNHKRYPLTWDGLCNILEDSDSVMVMKRLREALNAEQSTLRNTFSAKPSISATLKDNTIPILGEQYSLECTITGKNYLIDGTTCEIAWCKNGENFHTDNPQLSNTKSVKYEFGFLKVFHKGRYTCKVTIKRDLVVILETTSNHVDVQLSDREEPIYTKEQEKKLVLKHKPVQPAAEKELKLFCKEINVIIHVVNEYEFGAATTYITAPNQSDGNSICFLGHVLGMFAGQKVALVQTRPGADCYEDIQTAINELNLDVQYIFGVGVCYSLDRAKHYFGDVLVANRISSFNTFKLSGSDILPRGERIDISLDLRKIFCQQTIYWNDTFKVSRNRSSKAYCGLLISMSILLSSSEEVKKFKDAEREVIGGEMEGFKLMKMKRSNGLPMEVIVIKGVVDYGDESKDKVWQFTTAMAAFNFVEKMIIEKGADFSKSTGKPVNQYLAAYHQILKTRGSLDMIFLKMVFVGSPRLGKTSARRRLTEEIVDISSAGEPEQPSTGTVESGPTVVLRNLTSTTVMMTPSEWLATKNLTEEASILLKFIYGHSHQLSEDDEVSSTSNASILETETNLDQNVNSSSSAPFSPYSSSESDSPDLISSSQKKSESRGMDVEKINNMFHKVMDSEYWKDIKPLFENTALVRMEDTGGQPEFMDMLAALTIGPALYLLFCKLTDDLQSPYTVSYLSPLEGKSTTPVESTYTVEEVLLTTLAGVACMSSHSSSEVSSGEDSISPPTVQHELLSSSSKPIAYIVGTHKDLVSEQQVAEFDEKLQHIVRSTDFFHKDLVQFSSENRMVLPINNMTGGMEEIKKIQKFLVESIQQHFKKLSIPAAWLVLSIWLRKRAERIISWQDCLQLAEQLNMTSEELKVALWFLHHYAGVLMYFPDMPELKDTVICDIQIVYDSVTNLIVNTFRFGPVSKANAEKFRETGQFSLEDIRGATASISGDYIPLDQLVKLLEYLNIIAPLAHSCSDKNQKVVYFMPCILQNAQNKDLQKDDSNSLIPASLMIRYECGFVPLGLFPATIANLIGNNSFILIIKGIKKNRVHFQFGADHDKITFISRPRYYEIHITRQAAAVTKTHEVCGAVREIIESAIKTVTSRMNYAFTVSYQLAFECPSHPGRDHLCVVNNKEASPHFMDCLCDLKDPQPVKMENQHLVWFRKRMNIGGPNSLSDPGSLSPTERLTEEPASELERLKDKKRSRGEEKSTGPKQKKRKDEPLIEVTKYRDKEFCPREVASHCLKELSVQRYMDLALELGLEMTDVDGFEESHPKNSKRVLLEIVRLWMDRKDPKFPPSWEFLKRVLEEMKMNTIAHTI